MSEEKDRRMRRFAKGHARKLAPLINTLEQRLIQESVEHDGPIDAKDIKAICSTMARDYNVLGRFIYQLLKLYDGWDGKGDFRHQRKDILGRLLVHQFEGLIEGKHPKGVYGGALPRFGISGILRAFRGLVGTEIFSVGLLLMVQMYHGQHQLHQKQNLFEMFFQLLLRSRYLKQNHLFEYLEQYHI